MKRALGLIIVGLMAAGLAAKAAECAERLEVTLPPDWVLAGYRGEGDIKITEWVPPGESAESWTEMITLQVHEDDNAPSCQAFADRLIRNSRELLREPQVHRSEVATEEGVEAVEVVVEGQDAAATRPRLECHYKVLRGRDRLFVVQWVRQDASHDRGAAWWDSFARDVRVTKRLAEPAM